MKPNNWHCAESMLCMNETPTLLTRWMCRIKFFSFILALAVLTYCHRTSVGYNAEIRPLWRHPIALSWYWRFCLQSASAVKTVASPQITCAQIVIVRRPFYCYFINRKWLIQLSATCQAKSRWRYSCWKQSFSLQSCHEHDWDET